MKLITILRNAAGKEVGAVVVGSGAKLMLLSPKGKLLGYYNSENDSTYDVSGRLIGKTNLLASLLK
jgi:hypothetical protein